MSFSLNPHLAPNISLFRIRYPEKDYIKLEVIYTCYRDPTDRYTFLKDTKYLSGINTG